MINLDLKDPYQYDLWLVIQKSMRRASRSKSEVALEIHNYLQRLQHGRV